MLLLLNTHKVLVKYVAFFVFLLLNLTDGGFFSFVRCDPYLRVDHPTLLVEINSEIFLADSLSSQEGILNVEFGMNIRLCLLFLGLRGRRRKMRRDCFQKEMNEEKEEAKIWEIGMASGKGSWA